MVWLSQHREQKDIARSLVFNIKPKSSILLMPGYDLRCAKQGLARGIINQHTDCIFIENDAFVFQHIKKVINNDWPFRKKPILFNLNLSETPILWPLDFVFADLCGNLCYPDALMLANKLAYQLKPGADLAFTFTLNTRNNFFIKGCKNAIQDEYGMLSYNSEPVNSVVAAYIVLFKHVFFPNLDFGISIHEYHDIISGYNMLLVRLSNMQQKTNGITSKLDDMLGTPKLFLNPNPYGGYLMPVAKTKTETTSSLAAAFAAATTPSQKSVAKRRLNDLIKRREAEGMDPKMVKAGVSSWITRYKNGYKPSSKSSSKSNN